MRKKEKLSINGSQDSGPTAYILSDCPRKYGSLDSASSPSSYSKPGLRILKIKPKK